MSIDIDYEAMIERGDDYDSWYEDEYDDPDETEREIEALWRQ